MDSLAGATSLIQLIMTGCTEFPSLGLWVSNRILWAEGGGGGDGGRRREDVPHFPRPSPLCAKHGS